MSLNLTTWPELPVLPRHGEVAVLRAPLVAPRTALRQHARACVLDVLHGWGFASAALSETPTGPRLVDCGELTLSLAYTKHFAWIAFGPGSGLGIDATTVEAFTERNTVASTYLGPEIARTLAARGPAAFAAAWSLHEATLKYHRLALTEWHEGMPTAPRHASTQVADTAVCVVLDR